MNKEDVEKLFRAENNETYEQIESSRVILKRLKELIEEEAQDILKAHERILEKEERISQLEENIEQVEGFIEHLQGNL